MHERADVQLFLTKKTVRVIRSTCISIKSLLFQWSVLLHWKCCQASLASDKITETRQHAEFSSPSCFQPQSHGCEAKAIKVYKYVNMCRTSQQKPGNDIFPALVWQIPKSAPKLETLMTANKLQMVKVRTTPLSGSPSTAPFRTITSQRYITSAAAKGPRDSLWSKGEGQGVVMFASEIMAPCVF